MKETPKRPNACAEMLERQSLRQQGLLNAPVKGPKGLGGVRGLAARLREQWGGDHPPDWVSTRTGWRPPKKLV